MVMLFHCHDIGILESKCQTTFELSRPPSLSSKGVTTAYICQSLDGHTKLYSLFKHQARYVVIDREK